MQRTWMVVAIFCFIIMTLAVSAQAGPVGAPSYNIWHKPVAFSVSAGVGFGQRDIHLIDDEDIQDELNSSVFLTKLNLAPFNFLEIYGLIGAADIQLDDGDYKGVLSLAWGGGLRTEVFPAYWNVDTDFHIALDGQYYTVSTEDNNIASTFQEAQGALILSYAFARGVAPYGGLKYDYALLKFEGGDNDMRGDLDFAVFVGCDYGVTDEIFFNVDLTIFSETRIFAGVGYKY